MRILREKTLAKLLKKVYESGMAKGYELGWLMGRVEKSNRGFIIGSRLDQEIADILKQKERG